MYPSASLTGRRSRCSESDRHAEENCTVHGAICPVFILKTSFLCSALNSMCASTPRWFRNVHPFSAGMASEPTPSPTVSPTAEPDSESVSSLHGLLSNCFRCCLLSWLFRCLLTHRVRFQTHLSMQALTEVVMIALIMGTTLFLVAIIVNFVLVRRER